MPPPISSELITPLSPAIQEKLDIAQAKLIKANSAAREREAADVDNVVLANQEIQKTLDTQVELFQTFPNLTQQVDIYSHFLLPLLMRIRCLQLGAEVNNYLVAFENIKRDPSVVSPMPLHATKWLIKSIPRRRTTSAPSPTSAGRSLWPLAPGRRWRFSSPTGTRGARRERSSHIYFFCLFVGLDSNFGAT